MDNKNNNHESGNGFLLGIIIGSVATLLFTTKKGREILKDLTERGVSKLSELQENIDKSAITEEKEGNDYLDPIERPANVIESEEPLLLAKKSETVVRSAPKKEKSSQAKANTQAPNSPRAVKRLFRIKKN